MSHLILLRHAKSTSALSEMSDFKRTLNEKGRKDVPKIAHLFNELHIIPDIILCSTAYRTKETLKLFLENVKWKEVKVVYLDELYHASASGIFDILRQYSNLETCMIVGHNFGISDAADRLSKRGASEMSTCGLYLLQFKGQPEWEQGDILHYFSPKNI